MIAGIPFAPHMDPWVILKRQFLDDRERLREQQAISSSISGSTFSSLGSTSTTSALKNAALPYGNSLSVVPGWGGSGSAIADKTRPIPPPPPPANTIPVKYSKMPSEIRLNGQSWYNQTASRAVNQVQLVRILDM